jgi:hypothetical protein
MDKLPINHPEIEQLVSLYAAARDLEAASTRVRADVRRRLKKLDEDGLLDRSAMAGALGVTNQRMWKMLQTADIFAAPDVDEALQSLWESAVDAWEKNGCRGHPDDFFNVEAVLRLAPVPESWRSVSA